MGVTRRREGVDEVRKVSSEEGVTGPTSVVDGSVVEREERSSA
jgi:hypothetical protein